MPLASGLLANATKYERRRLWAPYALSPYGSVGDVWWENNIADFTTVTITGTQTIIEKDGFLAVEYSGQEGLDRNGVLKSHSFSVGDKFAVRIRFLGAAGQYTLQGLAFTDGTAGSSNMMEVVVYTSNLDNAAVAAHHGTLTNVSTSAWGNALKAQVPWNDGVYLRLTYSASDSFLAEASPDGINWTSFGNAATSKAMTPTHVGLVWGKEGGSVESLVNFGPICKVA